MSLQNYILVHGYIFIINMVQCTQMSRSNYLPCLMYVLLSYVVETFCLNSICLIFRKYTFRNRAQLSHNIMFKSISSIFLQSQMHAVQHLTRCTCRLLAAALSPSMTRAATPSPRPGRSPMEIPTLVTTFHNTTTPLNCFHMVQVR